LPFASPLSLVPVAEKVMSVFQDGRSAFRDGTRELETRLPSTLLRSLLSPARGQKARIWWFLGVVSVCCRLSRYRRRCFSTVERISAESKKVVGR
jgi:hypothetical protein